MKVAIVVVWRPNTVPHWDGRRSSLSHLPRILAYDRRAVPYTGIHLASLFPRRWHVVLIHEMVRDVDTAMDVDAVFLSTMDYCASHAVRLASAFRARGVKVIVGGLYATLNPAYFAPVADAVVVGEAEPVMPALVADLEKRSLAPLYRADRPADLSDLPVPRYDLVERDFSLTMAYEATRGCPFQCSFCILSAVRSPFRCRPIPHVIRDLRAVPSDWNWVQRRYIPFWDNNIAADRRYFADLCQALVPLKRLWAAEMSIDTITQDSARLIGQAGCCFVYIGLESLSQGSLSLANKRHNKVWQYRQRIRHLHDNGIVVMSIFLLGLDEDTADYLHDLPEMIQDLGIDIPVFSFPAPIEGTPFYRSLRDSERLVSGNLVDGMDGTQVLYRPKHLSSDELEMAFSDCIRRTYTLPRTGRRIFARRRLSPLRRICLAKANGFYRRFHLALAAAVARSGHAGRHPVFTGTSEKPTLISTS